MDPDKPDLASRLDAVFGRLGGGGGGTSSGTTWSLQSTAASFQAGKEDLDLYSSDDEAERAAPAPFVQPLGMDSDDEEAAEDEGAEGGEGRAKGLKRDEEEERRAQERFEAACSAQYRKQFEAEEEEDEYDRLALGGAAGNPRAGGPGMAGGAKPAGSMEVPDDNVFDRLTLLRNPLGEALPLDVDDGRATAARLSSSSGSQPASGASQRTPSWAQRVMAEAAAAASGGAAAGLRAGAEGGALTAGPSAEGGEGSGVGGEADMDMRDAAPATAEVVAVGLQPRGLWEQEQQQGVVGRHRNMAAATGPEARKRRSCGKHVRFRDEPTTIEGSGGRGDDVRQPRQLQRGGGGRRSSGGRRGSLPLMDWQRRGFVPDHVRNPDKYTVYVLDEPLTVGGDNRGRSEGEEGRGASGCGRERMEIEGEQGVGDRWRLDGGDAAAAASVSAHGGGNEAEGGEGSVARVPLAFGSGAVQFRRRGEAGAGAGGAEGEGGAGAKRKSFDGEASGGGLRPRPSVTLASVADEEEVAEQGMQGKGQGGDEVMGEAGGAAAAQVGMFGAGAGGEARAARGEASGAARRQFRSKTVEE